MEDELKTIEYTLKMIFNKDIITNEDVAVANKLLHKYTILTNQLNK